MSHRILALLLGGVLLLGLHTVSWALSEDELDQRVREISDGLRCPTCQSISVNDSEAAFSRQIKEKVHRMVKEGQTEEEIQDYFVSRYGEWILRAPRKEGVGLVLWVLPGLGLLGAGLLIGWKAHQSARSAKELTISTEIPALTDAQAKKLADDRRLFEEDL